VAEPSLPRRPLGLWWKRSVLAIGSSLFCLAALELALRLISPVKTFVNPLNAFHQSDPEVGWIGSPNLQARFRKVDFDVLVRHDARGFRARQATVQPKTNSPVIAVLGDSFTWGWGVENGSVFTDVLQNELGPDFDVQNLGVNAYGTVQELLLLQGRLKRGLRPRYLLLMVFQNDFYDNIDASGRRPWLAVLGTNVTLQGYPVTRQVISPARRLLRQSVLACSLAYAADFWKEKRHVARLEQSAFPEGHLSDIAKRAMAFALAQLRQTCARQETRLFVVYVPGPADVRSPAPVDARSVLQALCQQESLTFVDLTPGFCRAGNEALARYFYPHDEHWTAAGHALAGRELAALLQTEIAKPEPRP
jgi:lysophospholipase L1-like esterase